MAITNLFIARHGETEYNRLNRIQGRGIDEPLNEMGRFQSVAIAEFLKEHGLDVVVSSSLVRSRETAQLVADKFGVEITSYPELDEINFGIYEGRYSHEIEQELEDLHARWREGETDLAPEEGESPQEVLDRIKGRMASVVEQHEGKNILFVLHGRLIRILLAYWLGYGLQQMEEIKHSNGALNYLKWNGKAFEIVCLNKTDHLDGLVSKSQ